MHIYLYTVVKVIFLTKYNLKTSTVQHGKTNSEQILNILSDIKMTIYADSKSLKPKELVILSSKHRIYKSTKPFFISLNYYNFFNFNYISSKSIAITITI